MTKILPNYTKAEEKFNAITHGLGIPFSIFACILFIPKSSGHDVPCIIGTAIYGLALIAMYTISTLYHAVKPSHGKYLLRTLDHCTIYLLIAGTYTPILMASIRMVSPTIAWGLLIMEWGLSTLATTLTAIDLKKYSIFSMICYIFMGWGIMLFPNVAITALPQTGFILLLSGGIVYTIGAVLYGIGKKRRYFHGIFHVFVLAGSILQFACIFLYVL